MIHYVVNKCKNDYKNKPIQSCSSCNHIGYCPSDCSQCLQYIHYPNRRPSDGKEWNYDCQFLVDYYICKYSYKYASEIVYGLKNMRDIFQNKVLKVLSLGCGPCTDLFSLDYLHRNNELDFDRLEYIGFDQNTKTWRNVYHYINGYVALHPEYKVDFYQGDVSVAFKLLYEKQWVPDIIMLQYLLSDMQKHMKNEEIQKFICNFTSYFNHFGKYQSYILINDINLGNTLGGGRDYFEEIKGKIKLEKSHCGYFHNNNSPNGGFPYGREFPCNKIFFEITNDLDIFKPFTSCASAQMIIKKVGP